MQLDGVIVELRQEMLDLCEELRKEFQTELAQERNERMENDALLLEALDVWSKAEHQAAEESGRLLRQLDGLIIDSNSQKLSIQELFSIVELRGMSPKKEPRAVMSPEPELRATRRAEESVRLPGRPLPEQPPARDFSTANGEAELMAMCSKALDHHKVIATLTEGINFFSADLHWKILEPMREAEQAPRRWTTFDFRSLPIMVNGHMQEVENSYRRLKDATSDIVIGFGSVVQQLESERPGIISNSPDLDSKVGEFYAMQHQLDSPSTGVQTLISTLRTLADSGLGSEPGRALQEWIDVVQPGLVEARRECRQHDEATKLLVSTVRGVMSAGADSPKSGYCRNGNNGCRKSSVLALASIAEDQEDCLSGRIRSRSKEANGTTATADDVETNLDIMSAAADAQNRVARQMAMTMANDAEAEATVAAEVRDRAEKQLDMARAGAAAAAKGPIEKEADDVQTSGTVEVDDAASAVCEAAPLQVAPPVENLDELVDGEAKVFLADNQFLKSSNPGLCYHTSASIEDTDSDRAFVPWGSMVYGAEVCGGEWLKVIDRYLPKKVDGVTVLRPYLQADP